MKTITVPYARDVSPKGALDEARVGKVSDAFRVKLEMARNPSHDLFACLEMANHLGMGAKGKIKISVKKFAGGSRIGITWNGGLIKTVECGGLTVYGAYLLPLQIANSMGKPTGVWVKVTVEA